MPPRQGPSVTLRAAAFTGGLLLLLLGACRGGDTGPALKLPTPLPTGQESSLLSLDRFHYLASMTLVGAGEDGAPVEIAVSTEGDFQAPDRHAFTYSTRLQGVTLAESAVVIGDKIWIRRGDEPWQEAGVADERAQRLFSSAFSPIRPNFLGGPEWRNVRETVRRLPATPEFVNDVRAVHYSVGPQGGEYFRSFLAQEDIFQQVQDPHWELWLAEDGDWPVRLVASGTVTSELQILRDLGLGPPATWELRIDISRPNDPKLVVTAPPAP
jgi:hypothetical protein